MSKILYGKIIADEIRSNLKNQIEKLSFKPCLVTVLVGNDPASEIYVNMKQKAAKNLGMESISIKLDKNISEDELIKKINELNNDDNIDGILVQAPLPSHIDSNKIFETVNPLKDVDCFNPINVGKLFIGEDVAYPCTPYGVIEILKYYNISMSGKNAVIIGRSNIVGKPLAALLLRENATVTICHSKTNDIKEFTKKADIIIAAVGKAELVKKDWIKEGCTIIDVGSNKVEEPNTEKGYRLCGDVDFDSVKDTVSAISPSPGGVGPMTITMLLKNCIDLSLKRRY